MHKIFLNSNVDMNLFTKRTFARNEIVFNEGDQCNEVGFVEEGIISIKTNTFLENEYEINNIRENGIYGCFLIFKNNNHYLGTGVALKTSVCYTISKENLFKAFDDKIFLMNYLQITCDISLTIQNKVKVLSQGSIRDKIMFILINNYKENKSLIFNIQSKEQLAEYLCVPRPSLSRELIKMKDNGLIKFDRNSISLMKTSI